MPTQENRLPVLTLAHLLVALQKVEVQKVEARKTDRVEPLDPLGGQLGVQEERIRD